MLFSKYTERVPVVLLVSTSIGKQKICDQRPSIMFIYFHPSTHSSTQQVFIENCRCGSSELGTMNSIVN